MFTKKIMQKKKCVDHVKNRQKTICCKKKDKKDFGGKRV